MQVRLARRENVTDNVSFRWNADRTRAEKQRVATMMITISSGEHTPLTPKVPFPRREDHRAPSERGDEHYGDGHSVASFSHDYDMTLPAKGCQVSCMKVELKIP